MLFVFGRSISSSLSDYFTKRAEVDGHEVLFASMGEFADSEPFSELDTDLSDQVSVKDKLCVIFQSVTNAGGLNASSNYMQMLLAADTLKRNDAGPIWAMNPFAPFMRQDKIRPDRRESLASELSGRLMKESGYVGLSTVEAHSRDAIANYEVGLGQGNVLNIDPNALFAAAIQKLGLDITSVASPDFGADQRANDLANLLGADRFSIEKTRNRDGTKIVGQSGKVAQQTVMIDDMASTLGTARKGIELLFDQGSKKNILVISHPIMTGQAWDHLAKLIKQDKLERVLFLPTFSRDEEFTRFKQQYGPKIANKITFLDDEYNELIYNHVTQEIANHPAMKVEVG